MQPNTTIGHMKYAVPHPLSTSCSTMEAPESSRRVTKNGKKFLISPHLTVNQLTQEVVKTVHLGCIEIMPSDLEYDQILGEGQFGIVFKCTYRGQLCAVKKLKEGVDNGSLEYERLLLELSVLAGVGAHPNLVYFFRACVQDLSAPWQ